jgi:hypothetical protein
MSAVDGSCRVYKFSEQALAVGGGWTGKTSAVKPEQSRIGRAAAYRVVRVNERNRPLYVRKRHPAKLPIPPERAIRKLGKRNHRIVSSFRALRI